FNTAMLAVSAAGALNSAATSVYQATDQSGNITYVGITNDFDRRAEQHLASGRSIDQIPGLSGLSRPLARAVEQTLITRFGLGGKLGQTGQLLNKINSIKKGPLTGSALQCGQALLSAAGYFG
ncbi:MAG TPA: GIY-YIG nuclease family protein, partial [Candidatus Dormibacteraeota bacterium]|nr:GIY-YIG nuclease family protein [Candidatus Dormibacteraeota bacterium]